ncbi:hypothetical protein BDW42DRAFT_31144 [Aspergillus taichungensis]|uniref:Uncharacterized protein n=1 Tax=Aspergillus taichungensis TaxID=482145 RepID=A0A2J5I4C1_9EURO|nr:hypothetical protein BDW42DRAFT_31144 [Aspergillus taichungensis]
MRLAFILAILARQIDKYIFQPTYITPTDDDNKLRQFLNDQAAKDSEKESFCRSMLLSMDSDTQARTCVENVHLVVRNVSAYLDELLAEDQRHTFHEFLRKVVQKASEIWKPIQCSRRRFEPDFEPPLADDVWLPFAVPGSDKATAENGASKRYKNCRAISVFPRLSVIENDASTAYTAIIQLTSVHNQWMDADREMVQEPPSPTIGRVGLLRRTIANPKGLTISSGSSKKGGG